MRIILYVIGFMVSQLIFCMEVQVYQLTIDDMPNEVGLLIVEQLTPKSSYYLNASIKAIKSLASVNQKWHTIVNQNLRALIVQCAQYCEGQNDITVAKKFQKMAGMQMTAMQEWQELREIEISRERAFLAAADSDSTENIKKFFGSVDVNCTDQNGNTALLIAVGRNRLAVVEELLTHPVDTNKSNKKSATPLDQAVLNNNPLIVKQLIQAGTDVNKPGAIGWLPLMGACFNENLFIVKELLQAKVQVNKQVKKSDYTIDHGFTALMLITRCRKISISRSDSQRHAILQELLSAGADFNTLKNEEGKTARDLALGVNNVAFLQLFDEYSQCKVKKIF